jgi:glucose-6-phosphate 1-dehydrogenase
VIFGITGDLAARKLLPALYQLCRQERIHPQTKIVGYARSNLNRDRLHRKLTNSVQKFVPDLDEKIWASLISRIHYVQGDYEDASGFEALRSFLDDLGLKSRIFYTATPPATYGGIALGIAGAGLNHSPGFTRLVIEKPFGSDLESAQSLNTSILKHFNEDQIYRIDHYLAKETAQNLAVLRFANRLLQPIWSNQSIDNVQITLAEPMGMEGRGSFYEQTGVIRDVFQNHLLQLVALIAMEPPLNYDAVSVRNEKVKVFDAMAPVDPSRAILGQYTASEGMPGYRTEEGVSPNSRQATYAAIHLDILNSRWSGVPFFIRSGKRLEAKAAHIVLELKTPQNVPFGQTANLKADRVVLSLGPDEGITVQLNSKIPGRGMNLNRINLSFSYDSNSDHPIPDAYETLLCEALLGDATLFVRADEVEGQWRVVEPLVDYLDLRPEEPHFYPAGTQGPKAAYELLAALGCQWHLV